MMIQKKFQIKKIPSNRGRKRKLRAVIINGLKKPPAKFHNENNFHFPQNKLVSEQLDRHRKITSSNECLQFNHIRFFSFLDKTSLVHSKFS